MTAEQAKKSLDYTRIVTKATESVFQTVPFDNGLPMDVQLKTIYRRIERMAASQKWPPISESKIYDYLAKGVIVSVGNSDYVSEVNTVPLNGGALKRLERSIDKSRRTRYERDSQVVNRRRSSPTWRDGSAAKKSQILTSSVSLVPYNIWRERQKELQRLKAQEEKQRLSSRFIKKSILKSGQNAQEVLRPAPRAEQTISILCQNPEALDKVPEGVIFSIGFGVDKVIPLRVISYPLLGLELLRRDSRARLEFYVATQFADLRQLSQAEATNSRLSIQMEVMRFCQRFYPEVAARISFIDTRPLTNKRLTLINQFAKIIQKDPQIRAFARDHSGFRSLQYLAAHSLYMRDPLRIDSDNYLTPLPFDGRPVVMIGGRGEDITWTVRKMLLQVFGDRNKPYPSQLFTSLGACSPYTMKQNEPDYRTDLKRDFLLSTSPEVYRDFACLLVSIARSGGKDISYNLTGTRANERQHFLSLPEIKAAIEALNYFMRGGETGIGHR